jgi:hypothetical protein
MGRLSLKFDNYLDQDYQPNWLSQEPTQEVEYKTTGMITRFGRSSIATARITNEVEQKLEYLIQLYRKRNVFSGYFNYFYNKPYTKSVLFWRYCNGFNIGINEGFVMGVKQDDRYLFKSCFTKYRLDEPITDEIIQNLSISWFDFFNKGKKLTYSDYSLYLGVNEGFKYRLLLEETQLLEDVQLIEKDQQSHAKAGKKADTRTLREMFTDKVSDKDNALNAIKEILNIKYTKKVACLKIALEELSYFKMDNVNVTAFVRSINEHFSEKITPPGIRTIQKDYKDLNCKVSDSKQVKDQEIYQNNIKGMKNILSK